MLGIFDSTRLAEADQGLSVALALGAHVDWSDPLLRDSLGLADCCIWLARQPLTWHGDRAIDSETGER